MRKSTKGKQSKSVALVLAVLMTMIFGMQMAGIAVEESCAATDGTYDLPGEFMVNGDAYTDVRPIELLRCDDFELTKSVDISDIKNKMNQLIGGSIDRDTKFKDFNSTFKAKIKADKEISLDVNASFKDGGAFKIDSVTPGDDNSVTIEISLKDKPKTVGELIDAIEATPTKLELNLSARFNEKAVTGTVYKLEETLSGKFYGDYDLRDSSFLSYSWLATKNGDSKFIAQVVYNQYKYNLSGDLKIGDDTEHDKIYELKGKTFNLTSELNVKSIKDLIKEIAKDEGLLIDNNGSQILDDRARAIKIKAKCKFIASIYVPDHEVFDLSDFKPEDVELTGADGLFKITDVGFIDVHTNHIGIQVTMEIDSAEITNFEILYNKVQAVDDILKLNFKGLNVNEKAKQGVNYTFKGFLFGEFNGIASFEQLSKPFSFEWTAIQTDEGRDFINTDPDTKDDITFTMNINLSKPKDKPVTKPNAKNTPDTGDTNDVMAYISLLLISSGMFAAVTLRRLLNK